MASYGIKNGKGKGRGIRSGGITMKTLTIYILTIFLSVLCISCATFEQFIGESGYRLTVAGMIDSGKCIPIELKTVVVPNMEQINELLKDENVSPQIILHLINQIQIKYTNSLLLKEIMKSGLTLFLDKLKALPKDNPIPEPYLTELRNLVKSHLKGVKSAVELVDENNAWCE